MFERLCYRSTIGSLKRMLCLRQGRFRTRKLLIIILFILFLTCFYTVFLLFYNLDSNFIVQKSAIINDYQMIDRSIDTEDTKCRAEDNFVFIKCMKCGTETMGSIIRRYGYLRNLEFVLPIHKRLYIGWPYQMSQYDYRASERGYNILMEHAIYNKTTMNNLMPLNTKYITMIREPFSRFISTFHYFKISKITNMTSDNPIHEYLHNLEKYETIYKSSQAAKFRYCIPDGFSVTKNLLAHCLGYPVGFPPGQSDLTSDSIAIDKYIKQLDKDFTLVMIMDYYDESLVLLKRLFCWNMKDILYWRQNFGDYRKNKSIDNIHTPDNILLHQHHDAIDYKLYHYFNITFWNKIKNQGPDFHKEVTSFRKINADVVSFCFNYKPNITNTVHYVKNEAFSEDFTIHGRECDLLMKYLLKKLKYAYDMSKTNETKHVMDEEAKGKIKALC